MSPSDLKPDRNLALELVRVTEAAAMAAGRWVGRGDKNDADGVAVDAMRAMISSIGMRGTIVIGEGEKDNAPMLFNGEEVGDGTGPECDVAVDPIDGTTLTAKGMSNAISVLADHHRAAHLDRGDHVAHRLDGHAVRVVLVAATHPATGRHRGGLGDPHQLQGEVALGLRGELGGRLGGRGAHGAHASGGRDTG